MNEPNGSPLSVGQLCLLALITCHLAAALAQDQHKSVEAAVGAGYRTYQNDGMLGLSVAIQDCYDALRREGKKPTRKEVEFCVCLDLVGHHLDQIWQAGGGGELEFFRDAAVVKRAKEVVLRITSADHGPQLVSSWNQEVERRLLRKIAGGNTHEAPRSQPTSAQASDPLAAALELASKHVTARARYCDGSMFIRFARSSRLFQVLEPKVAIKSVRKLSEIDRLNGLEWDGQVVLRAKAMRETRADPDSRGYRWGKWSDVYDIFYSGVRKQNGSWELYEAGGPENLLYLLTAPPACDQIPPRPPPMPQ